MTTRAMRQKEVDVLRQQVIELENQLARQEQTMLALQEKLAEATLNESEEKYRLLVETANEGIWAMDREHRTAYVNQAMAKMLGYTPAEMLGKKVEEFLFAEDMAFHGERMRQRHTGQDEVYERRFKRRDGSALWTLVSARVIKDSRGEFNGSFAMFTDITERKRAEDKLLYQASLLQNVSDAIIATDLEFKITSWNQAAETIYGWPAAEVIGQPIANLLQTTYTVETPEQVLQQFLAQGFWRGEASQKRKDGSRVTVLASVSLIKNSAGQPVGAVAVNRNITERKQIEAERQAHLHFFASMDRVNQAIQGTDDLEQMMSDVLEVVLSTFDCDRAFLLYPCDPAAAAWGVPMERTRPEYPGALALGLEIPLTPPVAETLRTLLAADGPVKFGPESPYPLPADMSERFGFKSLISMALYPKVGQLWQFGLHQCAYARIWTTEEERLFQEIGRRLADALTSLLQYRDLRDSERRLTEAQRIAHIGYWERDLEAGRMILSDEACRVFGLAPQDFPRNLEQWHQRWLELIHPEDRGRVAQAAAEALRDGSPYNLEYRIIRPNGEVRFIHSEAVVHRAESGRPRSMMGMMQDITARKQAEEVLQISEARYRLIADHLNDIIWQLDQELRFVYTSPAVEHILGYSVEEANQLSVTDLLDAEDLALMRQVISLKLDRPEERIDTVTEYKMRHKAGHMVEVEIVSAPIFDKNRQCKGFVGVTRDIRERKQAEAARIKLEAQLRQAQKLESIGRLAGGVAHDFNNLLTVILGYTDLIQVQLPSHDPLQEKLAQVQQAAEQAEALTQQLLAFSRKQILAPVVLDLNELVGNLHKMLGRLIGEDIILEMALQPGLRVIKADPGQMEQVLLNLAVNARDAMPKGGRLTIQTANVQLEGVNVPGVLLAVADTGHGMDETILAHIFEPFFTTKEQGKGTGLGLATVYGIVKQSGGEITVESQPGQGTTFKIYLPADEAAVARSPSPQPQQTARPGYETILLVEDNPMVRNLVRIALRNYGYTLLEAEQGQQALALAAQQEAAIDLLLTDVIMPELSGREVAERLKALYPHIKVLFMSGYTDDEVIQHGLLTAEVEFISKPFSPKTLAAKVREILDK